MSDTRCRMREAQPQEAAALSALAMRSKAHWGYSAEFMRACEAELTYSSQELADHTYYVLDTGTRVIGFYGLHPQSAEQVELEALFVEPEHIGTGCGRTLMEHAKMTAATAGFRQLIVQGDPHAARFYAAAGGTLVGNRESDSIPGRFLPLFRIPLAR